MLDLHFIQQSSLSSRSSSPPPPPPSSHSYLPFLPPPEALYPPYRFDWPTTEDWSSAFEPQSFTYPDKHFGQPLYNTRRRSSVQSYGVQDHQDMSHQHNARYSQSFASANGHGTQYGPRNTDPFWKSQPSSLPASRPESPEFQSSQSTAGGSGSSNSIAPYLQLPLTISPSGGSLAEFAAKITCLFWFESAQTLTDIEDLQPTPTMTARLDTGFLKWVTTILTTTQVSPNVILLALLFIYRLKRLNPSVKGKPGSEFRLLTVALMLGNKFLDDNTYTNKTWAEVSGIAVQEIHVMEVEFLSHMKYDLYTSKEQWLHWHQQLRTFWAYFDNLSKPREQARSFSLRPLNLQIPYALPSPPNSTSASPPFVATNGTPTTSQMPYANIPSLPAHFAPSLSPATSVSEHDVRYAPRKRSYDDTAFASEPSAKRPYHLSTSAAEASFTPTSHIPSASFPSIPNLPVPSSASQQALHLPMPTPSSSRVAPVVSLPPVKWHQPGGATTPTRKTSSRPSSFAFGSNNPSPTAQSFPSIAAHSGNPSQLSPSQFMGYRNSPYKPVRNISTLLVPPPSGHMQQQQQIPYDQMSWMPLGRHNDRRTGRVPYLHREVWPQANQVGEWSAINYPVR